MASIYRKQKGGAWYVAYYPEPHKRKVVRGSKDKKATEALARKLETEAFNRRMGIVDVAAERQAEHRAVGIDQHVQDFVQVLQARGRSEVHVNTTAAQIRAVVGACEFSTLDDIDAAKVAAFIAGLKGQRKAARTINSYLVAFKSFTKWLYQHGRIGADPMPLVSKLNEKADRRRRRRDLADEELTALLSATAKGKHHHNMPGTDRAMLYLVAVETGLRSSELRSLTRESFNLVDLDNATVTVEAAYSKHRRDDVLPLRRAAAVLVAGWLADRPARTPAWRMPSACNVVRMFRKDLPAARADWIMAGPTFRDKVNRAKTTALMDTDRDGRVLDFHCLRHTFITRLARSGIHPKTAQALARHSTITLTMDHYTHSLRSDERAALDRLPAVDLGGCGSAHGSAQGTRRGMKRHKSA